MAISRIAPSAHHHHVAKPSRRAEEIIGAAKGTFPTVIFDQKLSAKIEKMRPSVSVHETPKGGTATLVYHFKSAAEATQALQNATDVDRKTGQRYLSPSLGDNIAEQLDSASEVGDPKLVQQGANLVLSVRFKPA